MLLAEFLTGFILIICGLLVKPFPNLIAGYNTMNKEEKAKIDIDKLSSYMRKYLVIIGCTSIIVGAILFALDIKPETRLMVLSGLVVIGVFIMVFKGQRHTKP